MEEERVCERGYAHIVGARKVGVERESGRGRGKQKSRGRDRQEDRDRQRQRDREKQQAQGSHSLPSKAYLQLLKLFLVKPILLKIPPPPNRVAC